MRTSTLIAYVVWLLVGLTLDRVSARPHTSELADRPSLGLEDSSSFLPLARSVNQPRELGIADIPACGVGTPMVRLCYVDLTPYRHALCVYERGSEPEIECMHAGKLYNGRQRRYVLAFHAVTKPLTDDAATARVNSDMCMLSDESQRRSVIVYTITVYAVALTLVVLRVAGKIVSKRLAWNDAPIVAAVLLAAVPIACVLAMAKIGFGEHLWNLEDNTFLPILRYFYIAWSTYVAILGLIKLSLIMFYLDVFPTRSFKIVGWIVFWYITINTLIIFLLTIFACTPVPAFWNRDLKGKCMDIQLLGYANSISAIVQDVVLVVLPMCYLRNLQMKKSRKLAVAVMFMIGSFGCITTIVRLRSLLTFKISVDPTWDYVPVVIWTELEITAAFACVSLPAIRVLLVKITPKSFKSWLTDVTQGSSYQNQVGSVPQEGSSRRNWYKDDAWINLSSTGEKQKGRIGLLPSAGTSATHLKKVESRSMYGPAEDTKFMIDPLEAAAVAGLPLPKRPVSVRSRFSN
ncbi:hypothetical protein OPT61_g6125 [Boeremia exigua]|uniref:Uncharacterized protein n=1 Tax=Boeremia exigua TaxID=749465 RepID=A0ACC2I7V5_9PLEO|nr:hypothetical protein OPT61_g6125 [Boeremia exigua]